jgi:EmrB/QacA subfamily drug resistance transporter
MGIFLATLDGSIVNIAIPTLEEELNTQLAVVQWVVLAYLLTITTLLLSIGRLADIIGKKSLYIAGFIIFTLGSGLCAFAPDVAWLIGFRVVQALGAALVMALGPAIITEAFPPSERGKALGFNGLAVSAGIITGPTLGGMLIDALSWQWIFLVNVPLGLIGTLVVLQFVPAIHPTAGQRFDVPGAVLLFVSLMCLLLGLTMGQQVGFDAAITLPVRNITVPVWWLFVAWLLTLGLFLWVEWHSDQPMIDLRLFRHTDFSISLVTGYISFVLIAGVLFLMPFYLENMLGYPPSIAGRLLSVLPIMLGITAPLSGWISDQVGPRSITIVGLGILAVGYSLMSQLGGQTSGVMFVLVLLPVGLGMGVFQSPNNSIIMGSVPPGRLGVASGLLAITRTLGQTTGIAILNTIWVSRVFAHAPGVARDAATRAPVWAQVAALHDVALVAIVLVSLALALSIGGWLWQRQAVPRQAETG